MDYDDYKYVVSKIEDIQKDVSEISLILDSFNSDAGIIKECSEETAKAIWEGSRYCGLVYRRPLLKKMNQIIFLLACIVLMLFSSKGKMRLKIIFAFFMVLFLAAQESAAFREALAVKTSDQLIP